MRSTPASLHVVAELGDSRGGALYALYNRHLLSSGAIYEDPSSEYFERSHDPADEGEDTRAADRGPWVHHRRGEGRVALIGSRTSVGPPVPGSGSRAQVCAAGGALRQREILAAIPSTSPRYVCPRTARPPARVHSSTPPAVLILTAAPPAPNSGRRHSHRCCQQPDNHSK